MYVFAKKRTLLFNFFPYHTRHYYNDEWLDEATPESDMWVCSKSLVWVVRKVLHTFLRCAAFCDATLFLPNFSYLCRSHDNDIRRRWMNSQLGDWAQEIKNSTHVSLFRNSNKCILYTTVLPQQCIIIRCIIDVTCQWKIN